MLPRVASSLLMVMLMVVVATLLAPRLAQARVDYVCIYGPVLSGQDASGTMHYYCSTEMQPPFVSLGGYVVARDSSGTCYECLCELRDDIGMACCNISCSRP